MTDEAIIYQLEKVDSGGDIADLFEGRYDFLIKEWGFKLCEDEDSPHYGEIMLPDGRYAGLTFEAYIINEEGEDAIKTGDSSSG